MPSRLAATAEALVESGWCAALLVVAVFFNAHSERTFEEDKIALLRSVALVVACGLAVLTLQDGRHFWSARGRSLWRLPLVKPVLLLTSAYCVSTLFSINPRLSLWGSYERLQGTYTWLSYIAVFAAMVCVTRSDEQRAGVVTTILLGSLPVAGYAVLQHFGYDSIRWGTDVTDRAPSTMGNAIFLAAYLIMVVPLTLVRLLEAVEHLRGPPGGTRRRASAALLVSAYLCLLVLQLLGILYAKSRGPLVGLGAGLAFFAVLYVVRLGRRWITLTTSAAILGGLLCILIFNVVHVPAQPLRRNSYINLVTYLLQTESGSGKVRTLIWQGATELLAAHPSRDLFGYGPETLQLAYSPFYPPDMAHYEYRSVTLDRAHNETFDALITLGVFGCAAEIWLFITFFSTALRSLGVIHTLLQHRMFFGTVTVGGALGAGLPYLAERSFRLSGLCLPLGIVAAMMLLLFAIGLMQRSPGPSPARASGLLLIGLFAAVVAHFIEIQVGIATCATRLLFCVSAALAATIGQSRVSDTGDRGATSTDTPASTPSETTLGLLVGLTLILITFDLYRPTLTLRASAVMLALILGTWLFGMTLVTAEATGAPTWRRLGDYAVASLVPWLLFTTAFALWLNWEHLFGVGREQVVSSGRHLSHVVSLIYAWVFAVIAVTVIVVARARRQAPPLEDRPRRWPVVAGIGLLAGAAPVIVFTNLNVSRADVFGKQANSYKRNAQWEPARLALEEALRLQPAQEHYATALVQVLLELARTVPPQQAAQRDGYLEQARTLLERAQRGNPLKMDHARNLARLHRFWVGAVDDSSAKSMHFDAADSSYGDAVKLMPGNAALWNEWAVLFIERQQLEKALALLAESLRIDDRYTTSYWIRANVFLDQRKPDAALLDYDRALAIDPSLLPAWSGKALALARLGRLDEAIAANRRALTLKSQDPISHRNLAILYQQTGQLDLALDEALAALRRAEPDDRPRLERFIEDLRAAGATPSSKASR